MIGFQKMSGNYDADLYDLVTPEKVRGDVD